MTERYAIYYAPRAGSDVWRLASEWLGHDSASGGDVNQFVPNGISAQDFIHATMSPRRYGFHATIKAPMRLAPGVSPEQFLNAIESYARTQHAVEIGYMQISQLAGFLAITPVAQSGDVTQFAAEVVAYFDRFRAPLSEEDRQKRLATGLTHRQVELVEQYGYPYVMEEYRMHLTLTDRLDMEMSDKLLAEAERYFAPTLEAPWTLDTIAVYREAEAGAPFVRLEDFSLNTAPAQQPVA